MMKHTSRHTAHEKDRDNKLKHRDILSGEW